MKTTVFRSTNRSRWRVLFAALLLAGYAFGLPLDAAALTVTRGPYLQLGTQSSIVVRWRTDTATNSRVRYGTKLSKLNSVVDDATSTTEHMVKLTGMNPSTKYYYAIGRSTATLAGGPKHFFVTAPSPGTEQPTHIWVVGNSETANAKSRAVRDAYLKYKGNQHTHLWLMLGDNAYPDGTESDYQAAVFNTHPTLLRQTVLWPTFGRRDGIAADSASQSGAYYDIFTLPKQGEAGGLGSGTEAHYCFEYGNIHFVVLDSVESSKAPAGAMLTWLKNDLAATTQPWIIAYWHHPPYSKGSHDSNTETALREMRKNALPILEDAGVDLVLNGHSGSYERSFLIDGHYGSSGTFEPKTMLVDGGDGRIDGNGAYQKLVTDKPIRGTVYTVVGSSGETRRGSLDHPVMHVSLNTLGSMVLDVNGPVLDAAFLDDTGQVRDRFRMVKTTDTAKAGISAADVPTTEVSPAARTVTVNPTGGTISDAAGNTSLRSSNTSATTRSLSSTSNLVAHWTLDTKNIDTSQSSAEVRDVSGYNNHADLKNHSATTVPGKLGQALSFDGVDDRAKKISFSGLPSSAITVSAWIKLDVHKNWNRVVNHEWENNGWLLYTGAAGTAYFGVGKQGVQYNAFKAGLTVGSWYHLVGVYDGSHVRIYVNGQAGTPRAKSGVVLDNAGNVDIGGADGDRFKGAIDDIRIYNRALTASTVQALYNGGGTTDTSPPSSPTNLTAGAVSSSQINLSWNASTDNVRVTGYKVYRGGAQIATTTGTSYSNTGLSPSTTYSYAVAAYDAAGNTSAQSMSLGATTQATTSYAAIPTPTKTAPIVSVTTFGAKGDGVADDTAAIQNAMDSMSSGGTLEFPPGTYKYSAQLRLTKPNVKLWGYGATLIPTNPDGNGISLEADNTHMYGFTRTAPSSWPRGCGSHSYLHLCYGIYIANSRNHEIIDNTINYGLDGPLTYAASDVLIARNTIYRTTADAIHISNGSTNIRVLQNTVRENGDDMIAVAGYEGRGVEPRNANILIEGNDVSGNYWGRGIAIFGAKDVTIRNNKISRTTLAAGIYVAVEGGWDSPNNRNILVEDNDIWGVQNTAAAYNPIGNNVKTGHSGIFVVTDSQGVMSDLMFRNNTLDNTLKDGVWVAGNVSRTNIIGTTMTRIGTAALNIEVSGTYCSGNTDDGAAVTGPQCTASSPAPVTGSSFP